MKGIDKIEDFKFIATWLILSLIVIVFSVYFNWSHWGNLALVNDDIHREFVTPVRLVNGEILYKDFNFLYSPLPPYINSLLIRIPISDTFTTLRIIAFSLFSLTLLFLWFICRDIGLSWLFGPVLFGIVSWTNSYTFNPSSFNGIYATLFATFGTWCAIRTLRGEKLAWYGLGFAYAGAFLSKPEGVFVVGLALIGACIFNIRENKKLAFKNILLCLVGVVSLFVPFTIFLFNKGLTLMNLVEGILQQRFQKNLSMGFIEQYNYFYGINHVLVITAGVVFIVLIFYLMNLYHTRQFFKFYAVFFLSVSVAVVLTIYGQLTRVTDDYQNLGDFFGGLLGYWWYRQLPDSPKKGFFIFWLSSLGGWLRPLFHIGALVIPFRVGGGMLLAIFFWFLMLPVLFIKMYPKLTDSTERIKRHFIKIGSLCVFIFGLTGLYLNWNSQWKFPAVQFQTKYGSFLANREAESTQLGVEVIAWLKENLKDNNRIVALEGLPIELVLDSLPIIPLSQMNYQIYNGDTPKIITILETRQDIKYILVHIRPGGYDFGIQDYKLADYLDNKWQQIERFRVPDQLLNLTQMSPARKKEAELIRGFIIYSRNF